MVDDVASIICQALYDGASKQEDTEGLMGVAQQARREEVGAYTRPPFRSP